MSESQKNPPLCKDCEYVRIGWFYLLFTGYEFAMCGATINTVDGSSENYCQIRRRFNNLCGEEGKLFKQKVNK